MPLLQSHPISRVFSQISRLFALKTRILTLKGFNNLVPYWKPFVGWGHWTVTVKAANGASGLCCCCLKLYLTNRPHFSMVYTLIDHRKDLIKCSKLNWNHEPQVNGFTAKFYGVISIKKGKQKLSLLCRQYTANLGNALPHTLFSDQKSNGVTTRSTHTP